MGASITQAGAKSPIPGAYPPISYPPVHPPVFPPLSTGCAHLMNALKHMILCLTLNPGTFYSGDLVSAHSIHREGTIRFCRGES
jgi:hypothetical protein